VIHFSEHICRKSSKHTNDARESMQYHRMKNQGLRNFWEKRNHLVYTIMRDDPRINSADALKKANKMMRRQRKESRT
jgi:hypothetical protein